MINIVKTQSCEGLHTWAGTKVYLKDTLMEDVCDLRIENCTYDDISYVWIKLPLGTITDGTITKE